MCKAQQKTPQYPLKLDFEIFTILDTCFKGAID